MQLTLAEIRYIKIALKAYGYVLDTIIDEAISETLARRASDSKGSNKKR